MEFQEMKNEELVVLVAPDGNFQPMFLAEDTTQCIAVIDMLHSRGISQSYAELSSKGFKILPIKITVVQNGTEEDAFKKSKEER